LLFVIARRLPAPIQEISESPTPTLAPQAEAAQAPKAIPETRATPRPTPKPRLIYAPAPAFPPGASQPGVLGTGHFHLTFDANGDVTNVQVVKSTGNPYFDQAAIKTLKQWKSAPSQGWQATVPITFATK
jgi:TonB family protein